MRNACAACACLLISVMAAGLLDAARDPFSLAAASPTLARASSLAADLAVRAIINGPCGRQVAIACGTGIEVVGEGGVVDGWRVLKIENDEVLLQAGARQRVLCFEELPGR